MYHTDEVDPLMTGRLYAHSDHMRNIYVQRTALDDLGKGLVEFNSSGNPGDVGVDAGPYGMAEYGGQRYGYDDGIPENYGFPSTPLRWYRPNQRDYYGAQGPTPYSTGVYNLTEPDHDPVVGEGTECMHGCVGSCPHYKDPM